MIPIYIKRILLFLVAGFFCLNPALDLFAQVPNYSAPIPLNMGDRGRTDPNANSILFFQHGAVLTSSGNFKDAPSRIRFGDNEETTAGDLLGAPGIKPQSGALALLDMLVGPEGLCLENFIPNLTCDNDDSTGAIPQLRQSWSQLVADLRNTFPGERNIPNVALTYVTLSGDPSLMPYQRSPLGSIVSTFPKLNLESPPAVCYDITAAEDWIACPVFGWVFMTAEPAGNLSLKGQQVLELQSPILLYRTNEKGMYKLAGYLANPPIEDQQKWANFGVDYTKYRFGNVNFPVAIASGNFSETPEAPDRADIAVVGTATLPHPFCKLLLIQLQLGQVGIENFPHGLNCSYGYTWVRTQEKWSTPRDTFDSKEYFLAGPKTYDLAAGLDKNKTVLFAPSNAPARTLNGEDHFYVYKFYEEGTPAISLPAIPIPNSNPPSTLAMPPMQQIPPRAIPVVPPKKGYGPFKIATADINHDGYTDFALTWKSIEEERLGNTTNNLWKANYSPFVSVYVSEIHRQSDGSVILKYQPKGDFQVPKIDSATTDDDAQLAAVSFLQKKLEKTYLVVGNQKRILVNGRHHAFDYFFPISSDGVVDTINVKPVRVSFKGEDAAAPGVADITVDFKGNVASVMRHPFIPAPEGCDVDNGEVYGALWFGKIFREKPPLYDRQSTGIPNRCRCDKSPPDNVFPPFVGDDSIDPQRTEVPKACRVVTRSGTFSNSRRSVSKIEEGQILVGELIQDLDIFPPAPGTGIVSVPSSPSTPLSVSPPSQQQLPLPMPCGFPEHAFSGPLSPCDAIGDGPREVTAVLAKAVVPVKACDPTKDEACKPVLPHQDISLNQLCIAKVGREDPKTSAVFEEDRKRIKEANDRAQSITGIKDFDIFVGGEAGAVHWECSLIGGAFASPSKVAGALPDVSGNVAPFAVWQTIGVPPLKFTNRPMPGLEIKNPLRLTPVEVSDAGTSGDSTAMSLSRSINLNSVLPSVSGEEFMTGDGVQAGNLNYNINGKVMIKVLQSGDDFAAEGASLSVSPLESLFSLDFVAYPALLTKTVLDSQLSFDDVFKELEKRVEAYKMDDTPITIDIYRNLPWEKAMSPEFLIAQAKLPDAVTAANLALQPPSGTNLSASAGPITNDPNQIVLPAYILPPGVYASGGGCGCRFNVRMQPDIILFQLLLLLVPLAGVIYYRHSLSKKK